MPSCCPTSPPLPAGICASCGRDRGREDAPCTARPVTTTTAPSAASARNAGPRSPRCVPRAGRRTSPARSSAAAAASGCRPAAAAPAVSTPAPEPQAALPAGERRQLTVLVLRPGRLDGSDGAAWMRRTTAPPALHANHARADEVIARYGGYVAQHLGDGLLVYFGWPHAYDDGGRSARCAPGWGWWRRKALNYYVAGVAARAVGGAALGCTRAAWWSVTSVTESAMRRWPSATARTWRRGCKWRGTNPIRVSVLGDNAPARLGGCSWSKSVARTPSKGDRNPLTICTWVARPSGVRGRLDAAAARGFTPFIGRDEERAMLRDRFERACGP